MKKLFILRHAQAKNAGNISDSERPLTYTGRNDIKKIADIFKQEFELPNQIISSPAVRALETATIFSETIGYMPEMIMTDSILYESTSVTPLINLVKRINKTVDSIILVGHNPLLSMLGASLSENFKQEMPKSSILGLKFNVDSWSKIENGKGQILTFKYPTDT